MLKKACCNGFKKNLPLCEKWVSMLFVLLNYVSLQFEDFNSNGSNISLYYTRSMQTLMTGGGEGRASSHLPGNHPINHKIN